MTLQLSTFLLLSSLVWGQTQEYVVTVPVPTQYPIHVQANDRLDAEQRALHATVWTTDEWKRGLESICSMAIDSQKLLHMEEECSAPERKAAKHKESAPMSVDNCLSCTGGPVKFSAAPPKDEAEDVEAIELWVVPMKIYTAGLLRDACATFGGKMVNGDCMEPGYYSCADKSRILLHDEAEPPHYYCHKINSGCNQ